MPSHINIPIIYEDDDILVINKPPGIVVNRSHTQKEMTIQDWVEQRDHFKQPISNSHSTSDQQSYEYGSPIEIFKERSGIVHRLDKETSGVLLIAKNPETLLECMAQFKARTTEKKYIALVHGKLQPQHGEINLPIGRNPRMRMQYAVREDGKESATSYAVLAYYPTLDVDKVLAMKDPSTAQIPEFYSKQLQGVPRNFRKASNMYQGFSLVEASPKTGRTHQIRVHLAHIKHPIVGDKMYSGSKKRLMDSVWCFRNFLHSRSLKIYNTRKKCEVIFEAPLSNDLEKVLELLHG